MNTFTSFVYCLLVFFVTHRDYANSKTDPNRKPQGLSAKSAPIPTSSTSSVASTSSSPSKNPPQSRNLKKIIEELEESDYGSFGSWGNFVTRKNPRKQPLKKADENPEFQIVNIDDGDDQDETERNDQQLALFRQDVQPLIHEIQKLSYSPRMINFKSTAKLVVIAIVGGCLSYCAVVPRDAIVSEYNRLFKEIALRLFLSTLWPGFLLWLIYGAKHAGVYLIFDFLLCLSLTHFVSVDVNQVVDSFFSSIVFLYPVVCLLEFMLAVLVRTVITKTFEPGIFELFPVHLFICSYH